MFKTYQQIMESLGHTRVDLLKIDIEGEPGTGGQGLSAQPLQLTGAAIASLWALSSLHNRCSLPTTSVPIVPCMPIYCCRCPEPDDALNLPQPHLSFCFFGPKRL